MRLKNVLIVVKDIEKSRKFYHDLFGIDLVLDNDGNMILTEGLVLQDEKIWKSFLGRDILPQNNACELYFEEQDRLLVKPVKSAISYMPTAPYELPYEGAKEMLLVDEVDNREFLTGLFHAMYDELPAPKPKKKK